MVFQFGGEAFHDPLDVRSADHITDPYHPRPGDSFTLFEAGKEARDYASTDEQPSFTAAIRHMRIRPGRAGRRSAARTCISCAAAG